MQRKRKEKEADQHSPAEQMPGSLQAELKCNLPPVCVKWETQITGETNSEVNSWDMLLIAELIPTVAAAFINQRVLLWDCFTTSN